MLQFYSLINCNLQGSFVTDGDPAILQSVSQRDLIYSSHEPKTMYSDAQFLHADYVNVSLRGNSDFDKNLALMKTYVSSAILYRPPEVFFDGPSTNASRSGQSPSK